MPKARKIMKYSKEILSMILMPKMGRLVSNSGSTAQCIAQANEVAIPNASQLNLPFIELQR
jgi:hypothetical protein